MTKKLRRVQFNEKNIKEKGREMRITGNGEKWKW
jgi:hypothetical protein